MSNLQLFVSSNHHSKPIQRRLLLSLKPTMDFSNGSHEQQQQQQRVVVVDMEEHKEAVEPEAEERLHSPSPSPSSSSSCTEVAVVVAGSSNNNTNGDEDGAKELAAVDSVVLVVDDGGGGSDGDGGYHTPTSPRHRIPAATECPRAPKKPPLRLRKKRKADESHEGVVGVGVEDVELIFCADYCRRAGKKPREDAVTYK